MPDGLVLGLRTVVSLAVVLALLVFFLRWLDRNSSRTRQGGRANAQVPVDVLSRTALSRVASVQVVRVGGQVLVLGVTETAVSVLTDLGPADFEHADGLHAAAAAQGDTAQGFVATLLRRQGRHRDDTEPTGPEPTGPEPTEDRRD